VTHTKLISIVCPVFNEVSNLKKFVDEVFSVVDKLPYNVEIIFAVDPSTDGTESLIRDLHKADQRIKMIRFSRRFGQPAATLAGLEHASGEAAIVMDVDLQDPPKVIPQMIGLWESGSPIVLAQRRTRNGEPKLKEVVSHFGYKFLNKFSEVAIPPNTGDFRLLDRKVLENLKSFPEANAFLRGLVALVGFESEFVYFDRPERFAGTTKYNKWVGSLKIGFNGIVGYSTTLLSLSIIGGAIFSVLAFLIAISYGMAKLLGAHFPIGNPTIVVSTLFLGGLNLLSIGILGMYIGRIYEEVKLRPRFIVQEYLGFGKIK
jgi:glycosyltransferase involved in cell wall biosynthesis